MLEKISSADIDGLLIKSAAALRSQQDRIDELEATLAERTRMDHAEKIAHVAVERGIMEAEEASTYALDLAKGQKDLDMVEDLVSRSASGIPLGSVLDKTASENGSEEGTDVLTSFLLTSSLV